MRMPLRQTRRIVWHDQPKQAAWDAVDHYPRIRDIVRNLENLLEKDPELEEASKLNDEYWAIDSLSLETPEGTGYPRVTLIYKFDEKMVEFVQMAVGPRGDDTAG